MTDDDLYAAAQREQDMLTLNYARQQVEAAERQIAAAEAILAEPNKHTLKRVQQATESIVGGRQELTRARAEVARLTDKLAGN